MKDEKFIEACGVYDKKLKTLRSDESCKDFFPKDETISHVLWMLCKIPEFIEAGRKEKANRWLGLFRGFYGQKKFIQLKR